MIARVGREAVLKSALKLLVREGYGAINIKAIAAEANCSTQPVSWHFENMDGMRVGLYEYGLSVAKNYLLLNEAGAGLEKLVRTFGRYIDLAYEQPNLFKFLYLGGYGDCVGGLDELTKDEERQQIITEISEKNEIDSEKAEYVFSQSILYVHGLSAMIACGALKVERAQAEELKNSAMKNFCA